MYTHTHFQMYEYIYAFLDVYVYVLVCICVQFKKLVVALLNWCCLTSLEAHRPCFDCLKTHKLTHAHARTQCNAAVSGQQGDVSIVSIAC